MAYFIFQQNNLHSIAANETDKNSLPIANTYVVKEVSDSDFLKVKKQIAEVSLSGDNVVVTDYVSYNGYNDENDLRNYHTENVIKRIDQFLNAENEDKSLYSAITSYKTYLENFDYSTMTFPMTKTWEEYCEDNSIAYVSPLQIP
jgi:hypothetical protein